MTSNFRSQALTASEFFFSGRTSHAGGALHLGRSALDAVELMNVGTNYLREHVPDIGLDNNIGEKKFIDKKLASAGDVNKDNVIDVLDAIYLEEHWETSDRKGDINFDGKIDMTDMNYIKQNFLKENPTVDLQNKPKSTEDGKTLQGIIDSLSK